MGVSNYEISAQNLQQHRRFQAINTKDNFLIMTYGRELMRICSG